MVFPGRFSTGCTLCKQRKVKCDEGKPSCRRCYIYGKPCPGYSDQFHFRHGLGGSQKLNKSASKQGASQIGPQRKPAAPKTTKRRIKQEQTEDDDKSKVLENKQIVAFQSRSANPSPTAPPDFSYDHVSLCYFVRRFVSPIKTDSFPGHLNFLPLLYNQHSEGPLELATMSVAEMAAFNQFGGDKFRLQSYQHYGRAVRALHQTLQTNEATDDRVIATILLLCTFKDISGDGFGDPNEHASGLYYLLEKRGVEQLATSQGAELLILGLLRLQVYSFLHQDDSLSDPGGLAALFGLFNPLMRAISMMSKTLRLRNALAKSATAMSDKQSTWDSPTSDSPSSQDTEQHLMEEDALIIGQCFETLEEFDIWDAEAPSYWQCTFEGRTVPAALGAVAATASYYDPETACTIILIRSARLVLLLSMLEYYGKMQFFTNNEYGATGGGVAWTDCLMALENDTRSTIDDMLASVPYALGDRDVLGGSATMAHDGAGALVILQSMRLVTYCNYATPGQQAQCKVILDRINASMGIRSAISFDEEFSRLSMSDTKTIAPLFMEERLAVNVARRASVQTLLTSPVPSNASDTKSFVTQQVITL